MNQFKVEWIDHGLEPQCEPDPRYPDGRDIDLASAVCGEDWPSCKVELAHPAKRCGAYLVECMHCGTTCAATTAGRPDDPKSMTIPCKRGTLQ